MIFFFYFFIDLYSAFWVRVLFSGSVTVKAEPLYVVAVGIGKRSLHGQLLMSTHNFNMIDV